MENLLSVTQAATRLKFAYTEITDAQLNDWVDVKHIVPSFVDDNNNFFFSHDLIERVVASEDFFRNETTTWADNFFSDNRLPTDEDDGDFYRIGYEVLRAFQGHLSQIRGIHIKWGNDLNNAIFQLIAQLFDKALRADVATARLLEEGKLSAAECMEQGHLVSAKFRLFNGGYELDCTAAGVIAFRAGLESPADFMIEDRKNLHWLSVSRQALKKIVEIFFKAEYKGEQLFLNNEHSNLNCDTVNFGNNWDNIQPAYGVDTISGNVDDTEQKKNYDELKLKLKRLTVNQLASIGVVNLVEGKDDEFICPFCDNGAGDSKTGLKPMDSAEYSKFHCFKCGNNFDNLDLFAEHFGLNIEKDFREILSRADELSQGISVADAPPVISKPKDISQDELTLIESDIADAQSHLHELPKKEKRNLDDETLRHFGVGYIAKWIHPKNRLKGYRVPPDRRIIVPTSKRHYLAALLKADRPYVEEGHKKHAGNKEFFNVDAINAGEPIIVVEGEFDAMSIWQCGFKNVVAIGGAAEYKKIVQYLADKFPNKESRLALSVLILFDSDEAGKLNSDKLHADFFKLGIPSSIAFVSEDKTDANDILIKHGRFGLTERIEKILADSQENISQARENISASNSDSENVPDPSDDLDYLKSLPPSAERDKKIVDAINKKLYLTPQRKRAHMKWIADSIQENAKLIFENDPTLDGLVAYDEFYHQYTFLKPVFWRKGNCTGEQWKDADDKELRHYLRGTYQNFKGAELINDNLTHYSREKSFHPVKEYLESLRWDGTPRAETFFIKFLNVVDNNYSREITLKWLLGAISRIYHEGCDFQFALVLHGKQGIGKGYCLRMLGKNWYIALADSLDDSHAIDAIERGWIVEIAELAAGRKAELNAQKLFLSNNADTRRKAYARRAETIPRHCVFAISVNDEHFLRDLTGNRRYKILESRSAQNEIVEGLTAEYVNQVWAEVFHTYQEMFKAGFDDQLLRLSREVDLQADVIAEKHLQDDGLQGEIAAFLDKPILPDFIWRWLNKDERRKFFVDEHIKFDEHELNCRIRANIKSKNKAQDLINQIDNYLRDASNNVYVETIQVVVAGHNQTGKQFTLYGNTSRESTCAAEIFNECFGNDKRKSPNRINEVLSTLDEWQRVDKRTKNFSGVYGQQRIFYECCK